MTKPVFSESNLNCDKHKFERFLQNDTFSMASCYGPIFVSTCPLLVFKRSAGEESGAEGGGKEFRGCGAGWTLVATGSLANVEPDRIMLKKVSAAAACDLLCHRCAACYHLIHHSKSSHTCLPHRDYR